MKNGIKYWLFTGILLLLQIAAAAQVQRSGTPKKEDQVKVDYADVFENIQKGNQVLQKLRGNVELRQDSIFMYCDSATIANSVNVVAQGNVVIQQGDTTSIFADSLIYSGETRQAVLFGRVVLLNGTQKLFTNRLDYDLNTKVATYYTGATLTNDQTQLSSRRGYYYVRENMIFFRDSVMVIDPEFNLRSDTLKFNTETKTVFFLGPTLIRTDSSRIYCEDGFYDTENSLAEFRQEAQYARGAEQQATADVIRYDGKNQIYTLDGNAQFTDTDQEAIANTIRYEERTDKYYLVGNARYRDATRNIVSEEILYDRRNEQYATKGRSRIIDPPQILEADEVAYTEATGLGNAIGNVIWQDTSANLTVLCEVADYNRQTNYLKAVGGQRGRPLLITEVDQDSLFMSADTLLALQVVDTLSNDTSRMLFGFYGVRIYKSNLQAVCDSLTYSTADSIFHLFKDPIIWSDTSQFIADTVNIMLRNDQIDRIFLRTNAFMINSPDQLFFNQVKGRDITAFFEDSELRRVDVQGNAESIYYALDESNAYIGVNKIVCSEMLMYFGNNTVERIRFYAQPQANLIPMKKANHDELKLPGFKWQIDRRPKDRDDLSPEAAIQETEADIPLESTPIPKKDEKPTLGRN